MNRIQQVLESVTSNHVVRSVKRHDGSERGAVFSLDETFRYLLWDIWDDTLPLWAFIMMNPSKATHLVTDPTVLRQCTRTRMNGGGGTIILNAGAIRETYSQKLKTYADCIGPHNREWISAVVPICDKHICGWGQEAMRFGGAQMVAEVFNDLGIQLTCFKVNRDGTPKHPLYVGYADQPIPYSLPR